MDKVAFYVGSRYTLFITFLMTVIYHKKDKTIIFLSDLIENWKDLKETMVNSGQWDEIIIVNEKSDDINLIRNQAQILAAREDICITYIPHIMRKFTHIYTNIISRHVKLVLLEEGSLTPVIQKEYKNAYSKQLDENYPDFNFKRIDEVFVFVPEVCDSVENASINRICIENFLNVDLEENIRKLNYIFGYTNEDIEDKVILIDDSYGDFGVVPKEYEFWCAKQMIDGVKNVLIKLKPCNSKVYNLLKWGQNTEFSRNSNIPFEIIFLNWYIGNKMPIAIISYPSSANINVLLFAKILKINPFVIVDINTILKEFMVKDLFETHDLIMRRYRNYYNINNIWIEPENWIEYYDLLECLGIRDRKDSDYQILERECRWFKEKYYLNVIVENKNDDNKLQKYKDYYSIAVKLLDNLLFNKVYGLYFEKNHWQHIGLFGAGIIADRYMKILSKENIYIQALIVSS